MAPTWRERVRRWRERAVRWLRGPGPKAVNPYRTAAPELLTLPTREARMRADLSDGWVAGRASARAARSIALRRLRVLWTAENMSFIPMSIGVGAVCGVLAAVMIRLAPFFGARLSTTATHILAIPCGIVVGLCIGVAFLALGAVALGAAVLLVATTAIGLYALATTVYGLLVVSARVALARAKSRHTTAD